MSALEDQGKVQELDECAGAESVHCAGRGAVEVPCRVLEVSVPKFATAGLKKAGSLEVRVLLAERWQRIGYEVELVSVVTVCK